VPQFDTVIRAVVRETPEAVTLQLDPGGPVDYRAGQFVSVDPHNVPALATATEALERAKGRRERPRAYSLSSAPHEPLLAITVREEPTGAFDPLLSPWLCHDARPGDRLLVTGFNGFYTLPDDLPSGTRVLHLSAGSGVVPDFALVKDSLHRGLDVHNTLVVSARTWDEVIFRDALIALSKEHSDRLRLIVTLTRETRAIPGVDVRHGRLDAALVGELVGDPVGLLCFTCGPGVTQLEKRAAKARGEVPAPKFLETVQAHLAALGVPRSQVVVEGW
jgi:ferredoxin-NADP reductase